jgi:hypothetical protein
MGIVLGDKKDFAVNRILFLHAETDLVFFECEVARVR